MSLDQKATSGPFSLALGKGFSDHPSYLFQNRSHEVNEFLNVWLFAEEGHDCINLLNTQEINSYGRVLSCSRGEQGDKILMDSVITDVESVVCNNERILEHVYLWYDDNVLIFWSCKEVLQSKKHDGAIFIIGMLGSSQGDPSLYPSSDRIKATVSKYIDYQLFTDDEWRHLDLNKPFLGMEGPELFPCLMEGNYLTVIIVISFLLIGGATVGFKLRPSAGGDPPSNNRVNPSAVEGDVVITECEA